MRVFPRLFTHKVIYDGVAVHIFHVNKGEGLARHEHTYAHLTMCHAGSCVVRKEGKELIMTKNTQPVNLLADGWHEIEALEDNTIFVNVFSERKQ
jgi:hypothetical protein